MQESFDPGALLARTYALEGGLRVCLRLARISDLAGIEELLAAHDAPVDDVNVGRLVRSDPRLVVVLCATALVDSAEQVVGVGAIDVEAGEPEPSLLVVDERVTDGLDELLHAALLGRAAALRRDRAA